MIAADDDDRIPVRFAGLELVWLKDSDGTGPLAYPHHLNESGDVTAEAAFGSEDSFAHVFSDGTVKRYGKVIGTVDDFEFLPATQLQGG